LAKAAASTLLLYLSLRKVDIDSIRQGLNHLDLRWIPLIFFALCTQTVLLAARWRDIGAICGAKLSPVNALRYSFIGQFFSQVLPSTVGGDAVRVWLLARSGPGWAPAVHSVLIDRLLGISVLAVIVVACLPWTVNIIHDPIAYVALALIGFGALAATLAFLAIGIIRLRILDSWWLTRPLVEASRVGCRVLSTISGARAAAITFPIHLLTVTAAWGAAMATHAAVDFTDILFLVLPVMLIASIPISIAGWGLRESTMVLAFSYAGLASTDGLMISIILGVVALAVGIVGGIFWVASGYQRSSISTIAAENMVRVSAS
jgi:uncharacterized membrane protein YbhN (UPF0104 family)